MNEYIIQQLLPATNWSAEMSDGSTEPLVCWALVQYRDGTQAVIGMIGDEEEQTRLLDPEEDFENYSYDEPV
ncbi:MAG: hypothetical protein ACPGUC_00365 [Gammaproteobacteria bacterium]